MDNNKLYNDFEEMKEQMSLLKNKLAKQSLINEKLIRQSMSNNQSYINRQGRSSIITAFVTIPLGIAVFALYGFRYISVPSQLQYLRLQYTRCGDCIRLFGTSILQTATSLP